MYEKEAKDTAIDVIDQHVDNILKEIVRKGFDKSFVLQEISMIQTWVARYRIAEKSK